MKYRACYMTSDTGGEVRLTGPEHAALPDEQLIAEAVADARMIGLVVDRKPLLLDVPAITPMYEGELRERLTIGEWAE